MCDFVVVRRKNYSYWQGSQVAGVKISHRTLYCVFSCTSALPIDCVKLSAQKIILVCASNLSGDSYKEA